MKPSHGKKLRWSRRMLACCRKGARDSDDEDDWDVPISDQEMQYAKYLVPGGIFCKVGEPMHTDFAHDDRARLSCVESLHPIQTLT
ncbi:hypothetical protein EXIGLDRAFT_63665 [Exidia glandulosa HHB12029]|uniref:Uncharacterized protein n=1 Tax=Exidia glandulosa HHB12029 TaxID=1314781 RepID=A0A165P0R3_EXIGL|nr:hypothetical protein EXIGLDRAFT_63665 [Exidia glandulosa HHB12029]